MPLEGQEWLLDSVLVREYLEEFSMSEDKNISISSIEDQ